MMRFRAIHKLVFLAGLSCKLEVQLIIMCVVIKRRYKSRIISYPLNPKGLFVSLELNSILIIII
jgi:hypothetical protein